MSTTSAERTATILLALADFRNALRAIAAEPCDTPGEGCDEDDDFCACMVEPRSVARAVLSRWKTPTN